MSVATELSPAVGTSVQGLVSNSREFQQHIHIFRAVAICLIIAVHSLPSFEWESRPLLGRMLTEVFNQATIFFVFISGYLFQHLLGRFTYRRYLKQKFKAVILPYILASIPAVIISVWFIPQEGMWGWFYDLPAWQQVVLFYLTGKHLEPFWFIPTLALFYLAAPLLKAVSQRPVLYWSIPVLMLLAMETGRGGPWGPFSMVPYVLPAYLFGMCYSHFRGEAERLSRRYFWVLLGIAGCCYAVLMLDLAGETDLQILMKLALCPVLLLAFRSLSGKVGTRFDYVAHVSFGIYFVHAYLIAAFRLLWTTLAGKVWGGEATTALFEPSLFLFAIHTAAVLVASLGVIWLVRALFPKHSRQLIGA